MLLPIFLFLHSVSGQFCDNHVATNIVTLDQTSVEIKDRVDCHPEPGAFREKCEERGCVWGEVAEEVRVVTNSECPHCSPVAPLEPWLELNVD